MRVYHEQLRVPASWWALGFVLAVLFGGQLVAGVVYAGYGWPLAWGALAALVAAAAAALGLSGRAAVQVRDGELVAGRARLPLDRAGEVTALDERQTRRLRTTQADPGAFVLTRPYLKRAVYIQVTGPGPGGPYWLVGSRHPEQLAAAIGKSRPVARTGDVPVG
jgi:hypothetical protein